MTGEMSREEVTRSAYPLYFACADQIEGATVKPFDNYQGPYISVPGKGRIFLTVELDRAYHWYSEKIDALSDPFCGDLYDFDEACEGIAAFLDLIETGGCPIEREG